MQLVKAAERSGVTVGDALTLIEWANEVGLPSRNDIGTNHWVGGDHVHIGGSTHIPVRGLR
jgi:hypothetical protein